MTSLHKTLILLFLFSALLPLYPFESEDLLPLDILNGDNIEHLYSEGEFQKYTLYINEASEEELIDFPLFTKKEALLILKWREGRHLSSERDLKVIGISDDVIFTSLPYLSFRKPLNYSINQTLRYYYRGTETIDSPKAYSKSELQIDNVQAGFALLSNSTSLTTGRLNYTYYLSQSYDKHLKQLTLGKYRLAFGQGLAYAPGSMFSKSSDPLQARSSYKKPVRLHTSPHKAQSLEGAAAIFSINNNEFIPFHSNTQLNATISDGKTSTIYPYTFPNDNRHNSLSERVDGMAWRYICRSNEIGAYFSYNRFGREFVDPNYSKKYTTLGSFYSLDFNLAKVFGEYAHIDNQPGFVGGISWGERKFQQILIYRSYAEHLPTWHGNPFASKSKFNNEKGYYYGIKAQPHRLWSINLFFDISRYPFPRYFELMPTTRTEQFLLLSHKRASDTFRLKFHHREYDKAITYEGESTIFRVNKLTTTLDWTNQINRHFRNRCGIDYISSVTREIDEFKDGLLLYNNFIYRSKRLETITQISVYRLGLNHYTYEYTLDNWQETKSYNGNDIYAYQIVKVKFTKLTLQAKVAHTFRKKSTNCFIQLLLDI